MSLNRVVRFAFIWAFLLFAIVHRTYADDQYRFDGEESHVAFEMTHFGITTAAGEFGKFEGLFSFDPDKIEDLTVTLNIQTNSVTSKNPKIPGLMRSKDFFWSDKHPEITFVRKKVERISDKEFNIYGDLSIRGKTNPAIFETKLLENGGGEKHPLFHTHTFIDRKDYGLGMSHWFGPLATVMAESLKISLEVEGIQFNSALPEH